MRMWSRGLALMIVVGVSAALAGCVDGTVGAEATSSTRPSLHSPTPTPTPTPIPTPGPSENPADPSTWLVTFAGIGPLKAGTELSEVAAELSGFEQLAAPEEQCSAYVYKLTSWSRATASGNATDHEHAVDVNVSWMGSAEAPRGADVARSPRTERGIGIGSTIAEVQAAYPDLVQTRPGAVPTYGITDGTRWILFRDLWAGGTVSTIQVGTADMIGNEVC